MKELLLKKLAALADQLDIMDATELADEVDTLMSDVDKQLTDEVARRAQEEETHMAVCPECEGSGAGQDSPWCEVCKGEGFVKGASLKEAGKTKGHKGKGKVKPPYVRRRGSKWVVIDKHSGKVLSTHDTEEKAKGSLAAMHMHKG